MKLALRKARKGDTIRITLGSETWVEIQVKHCGHNAVKLAVLRREDFGMVHEKSEENTKRGAQGG